MDSNSNIPTATTVTIERLSHEGRGLGQVNGKTVFVAYALPQETVEIRYTKRHSQFDEAAAVAIQTPSPERVSPVCEKFTLCGGCQLQHMSHTMQLALKQQTLLDHLQQFAKLTPERILSPIVGPIQGYRSRARLSVKYLASKNELLIGFHESNGRAITRMDKCPVLAAPFNTLIGKLKSCLQATSIKQFIPQLEFCAGIENALIIRHLQPFTAEDLHLIQVFAQKEQLKVYLQPGNQNTIRQFWPEGSHTPLKYVLENQGIHYKYQPAQFTQINQHVNQQMVDLVIKLLDLKSSDHVLDLFCGLGNFTLPLAKLCASVVGVEGLPDLVNNATQNAADNGIVNAHFYTADLTQPIENTEFGKQIFDKILLDPSRNGALEIIEKISTFQASRIVYVSCNTATLARDAAILVNQGYKLVAAGILDMFVHTRHTESVALFCKL